MKQEVNLIRARLKTASWGYGREAAIRRNRRLLPSKANVFARGSLQRGPAEFSWVAVADNELRPTEWHRGFWRW